MAISMKTQHKVQKHLQDYHSEHVSQHTMFSSWLPVPLKKETQTENIRNRDKERGEETIILSPNYIQTSL